MSLERPSIRQIQTLVCARFNVDRLALVGDVRSSWASNPRHAAIWLTRRAAYTFPRIAREFHRDCSTVQSAVKRIDRLMSEKPAEWGALMTLLAAEVGGMGTKLVMPDG